jgi:hypothetical protein
LHDSSPSLPSFPSVQNLLALGMLYDESITNIEHKQAKETKNSKTVGAPSPFSVISTPSALTLAAGRCPVDLGPSAPSLTKVDHARVTTVGLSDSPSRAIGRFRYRYQMDMIGHQAIRHDLDLESVAPLCHELDVALVIFVTEKRLLSAVSALRDVMRKTRCDNTC